MMRFILDCLRPGRTRTACARENSVEIQTKEKEAANDHELKELEDVVAMEEGALQRERGQCRDSQQALESLAQRRAQLREQIEKVQEQRKQEGQLLLSLQEEQEELEQTVREYEAELQRAQEDLERHHQEISRSRARVEDAHGRMGTLKRSIGETYTEISEAKQKLGELIAEMIAIETCVPEIACHQTKEKMNLDCSREEEDDTEMFYDNIYSEEDTLKYSMEEKEQCEQNPNEEEPENLQRSAENLKSSGSSSFTEITLTEVKEEDTTPKSVTPQHIDSPNLEEEDFEIVQSHAAMPVDQTSREFDFYHPDPFVDHDVFGDDRFPKVDMTEFLSGDPFKGTDPFASDMYFNDVADAQFSQEESNIKESNPFSSPAASTNKDEYDDGSMVHYSAGANCSQSIDSGMFDQNLPEPSDSERYTPYSDICTETAINITMSQDFDSLEQSKTTRTENDLPESLQFNSEGRFDPIHCEQNDIHDSMSSNSSTVDSSFDGDFGTGMEQPVGELEQEAEPSHVRRNQALYGLQRIDTSTYTSFPLSPEAYDPVPDVSVPSDDGKSVQAEDLVVILHSKPNAVSDLKCQTDETERASSFVEPGNPGPLSQEAADPSCEPHTDPTDHTSHTSEPGEADSYDHKFGDIYFFTVRLDPGSPDASPVSAEASDAKKSECDHASPESNDTDEFEYGGPEEEEEPNQYGVEVYTEKSSDRKEEPEIRTEHPISPDSSEPVVSESEMKDLDSPYSGPEYQSSGLDPFKSNTLHLESNLTGNTENVGADTNSDNCHTEPTVQYLISPVSADTTKFITEGHKLCALNPFSLESGSIDHFDGNPEPSISEANNVKESDSFDTKEKDLDPFSSLPMDNTTYKVEVNHPNSVNSVSTDSGRLDSGYHENNELDPFSPVPTELCQNTGPGPGTHQPEMLSNGNLDLHVPDPFSPDSNDTMVFDSGLDICNSATNAGLEQDPCVMNTTSSNIFGDSFSASELECFDPFSPVPHFTKEGSLSSQPPSGSAQEDSNPPPEGSLISPEAHIYYSSNCSAKEPPFMSDSESEVENITEQDKNSSVNVTAMADLAEIDFFCSELSRMVASRSSDTVQQSVAEMLFGSNPDNTKFYPWDLENSDVVNMSPSEEGNKLITDLPKLEAGPRMHTSGDLLGEFHSTSGTTIDVVETPSLL